MCCAGFEVVEFENNWRESTETLRFSYCSVNKNNYYIHGFAYMRRIPTFCFAGVSAQRRFAITTIVVVPAPTTIFPKSHAGWLVRLRAGLERERFSRVPVVVSAKEMHTKIACGCG